MSTRLTWVASWFTIAIGPPLAGALLTETPDVSASPLRCVAVGGESLRARRHGGQSVQRVATITWPLLVTLLAACASSDPKRVTYSREHIQRTIAELSKAPDADSLAAAGLLLNSGNHEVQSLALLARATTTATDRPDLAWLHIQMCLKVPSCQPEPMSERLRSEDPTNGAGWLALLGRADSPGAAARREAALLAISQSDRVDIYWTTLIGRLTSAAARPGFMSIQEAELAVIGALSAQDIPSYRVISDVCVRRGADVLDNLETCRGVARALERGDTYATEMIGIAIAKRVWPEASPEWTAATRARAIYEYRTGLMQHLEASRPWDRQAADNYLSLCARYPREQDVVRARLLDAGMKAEPPVQLR